MRAALLGFSCLALPALLAGCAAKPTDPDAQVDARENNDPYESVNRKLFGIYHAVDTHALRPVAVAYRDNVPRPVRGSLHNVLNNIANPVQFCNDVLQGKPRRAGDTFVRTVLNTSIGLGGFFDVATGLGYPDHSNDFGLTLALWGVPSGPFLFLPVLGPSDFRDGIGYGVSSAFNPLTYASFGGSNALGFSVFGVGALDGRTRALTETDSIERSALDPYATYRSLYQQHRAAQVTAARIDRPATVPSWYASAEPAPATIAAPKPPPASPFGSGAGSGAPTPP